MCTSSTCIGMLGKSQLLQHKLAGGCMRLRSLPSGLNTCGRSQHLWVACASICEQPEYHCKAVNTYATLVVADHVVLALCWLLMTKRALSFTS